MMEELPLDVNNPAVRDYLALIRHVPCRSLRMERAQLTRRLHTRPIFPGTQITSLDAPQPVGKYHGGAGV